MTNRFTIKKSGTDKLVLYKNGNKVATASYSEVKQPYAWMPRGYKTEIENKGVRRFKGVVPSVADIKVRLMKAGK